MDPNVKICGTGRSEEAAKLYLKLRYPPFHICPTPCRRMSVNLASMSRVNNKNMDTATVTFLLKSRIQKSEEVLHQNMLALLGEIGGLMGLFLGFSLLDLSKLDRAIKHSTHVFYLRNSSE